MKRVIQFFREIKIELRKVTWPPKREVMASTSVVLIIVIITALFFGLVDLGFSKLIKVILS